MKKVILVCGLAFLTISTFAQTRFLTKNGKIHFDCTTPSSPESIDGTNDKATSIIDAGTGAIEFALLMKAFHFEKALMEEHFNENYVESDKFPKASFKGTVTNMSSVTLSKDGTYQVTVKGQMTIHGVTKEVSAPGTLTVKGGAITGAKSEFKITLADFDVTIPSVVKDKVASQAKITVDLNYQPVAAK
jgi:uncharacterized protein YdeI (BOF family)